MTYIKSYTSLRGIAAWWVVFYHFREALPLAPDGWLYALIDLGYISVDFFFVLSGFVIYLNYSRMLSPLSAAAMKAFLVKRLARVYPLYFVVTLAYLSIPLAYQLTEKVLPGADRFTLPYFWATLAMVQNWGGFDMLAWNIPAWSISTEFAAYLLFPAIVIFLLRSSPAMLGCFAIILVCAAVLAGIYAASGAQNIGADVPGLGLYRCVAEFTMGMLVGRLHEASPHHQPRTAMLVGLVILAIAGASLWHGGVPNYGYVPLTFTFFIWLLSMQPRWSQVLFGGSMLVYLGEISYSTYLCHYFVKDWVKLLSSNIGMPQFCIYTIAILLLSHVLYQYVEVPGRRWGRSFLKASAHAG